MTTRDLGMGEVARKLVLWAIEFLEESQACPCCTLGHEPVGTDGIQYHDEGCPLRGLELTADVEELRTWATTTEPKNMSNDGVERTEGKRLHDAFVEAQTAVGVNTPGWDSILDDERYCWHRAALVLLGKWPPPRIAGILVGSNAEFEIDDLVERVRALAVPPSSTPPEKKT